MSLDQFTPLVQLTYYGVLIVIFNSQLRYRNLYNQTHTRSKKSSVIRGEGVGAVSRSNGTLFAVFDDRDGEISRTRHRINIGEEVVKS